MMLAINFLIFSFLIFAADQLTGISLVRMQRRVGLTGRPLSMFFNIFPSYIRCIFLIFIVFAASQILYIDLFEKRELIFLPLLMIFLTTIRMDSRSYTFGVTSSSYLLSVFVCTLTALSTGTTMPVTDNPFSLLSFIISIFSVSMLRRDDQGAPSMAVARNLALNIYLVSVFIPGLSFIWASLAALVLLYGQFLTAKTYPKFNLFHSMRQSLTLVLTSSFVCLILSIMWATFIKGGI